MDVGAVCGEAHFQRDCGARKNTGKQTSGRGNQSKSLSMSELSISGEGKSKENQRETKGLSKGTKIENKGTKGSHGGKTLEMGQVDDDNRSWIHEEWSLDERNGGWSFDGWNDDGNGVEWREACEQTHVTSASSFSLEGSEWEEMNFGPEGIGGGSFHDWIPDGEAWQFQGYDESGFTRSLDGRLMDAYEVLSSSASASASAPAPRVAGIARKEQQDFYVKRNGGYMIPTHSKIGQEMRIHFENLLDEYGTNELIQVCLEEDTLNFYLNREVKSEETYSVKAAEHYFEKNQSTVGKRVWQSASLVSPTTTLNRYAITIGDDIEPVGESLTNVEEEESLEPEILTVETNLKDPMSRTRTRRLCTSCLQELVCCLCQRSLC